MHALNKCNRNHLELSFILIQRKPSFRVLSFRKLLTMSIRIVKLGSPRLGDEGVRIGTVRRPPRGVPRSEFAIRDWYDVWFPNLAPSLETMKLGLVSVSDRDWATFTKQYRNEMRKPAAVHDIELLAALSKSTNFSVGCYCESEDRCHRSILRGLLLRAGADVA